VSQRGQIGQYAALYGHDVVAEAIDLDVTGSVSPFEREQLGPYLNDPKLINTWDGIIVSKLDRLGRSVVDFATLLEWCRANNKTVISVAQHLDFSTAAGVMFANVLIAFAQFERERMAERRRDAAKTLREAGRWGGGRAPFGYRPERDGNGWILVKDEHNAAIVEEMADRVIAGETVAAVSRWLNDSDIPTPGNAKENGQDTAYQWWPATVRNILRSRSLLGEMTHKGAVVRGPDGMPLRFDPIIDDDKWTLLQAMLDMTRRPLRGERSNGSYLLRIAYCTCGDPLFQTYGSSGKRYYRCRSGLAGKPCGERLIPMADLAAKVDEWIMSRPGFELTEKRVIHGNGNAKQLADVGRQIAELTAERYVRSVVREDYHEVMTRLQTEYDRLSALETQSDRIEVIGTGRYLSDEWPEWDESQRRRFLTDHDFRFAARRNDRGEVELEGTPGETYREKVADRLSKVPHPRPNP
jgi:DNA invertase Pin-like site-specific DNA recombinase